MGGASTGEEGARTVKDACFLRLTRRRRPRSPRVQDRHGRRPPLRRGNKKRLRAIEACPEANCSCSRWLDSTGEAGIHVEGACTGGEGDDGPSVAEADVVVSAPVGRAMMMMIMIDQAHNKSYGDTAWSIVQQERQTRNGRSVLEAAVVVVVVVVYSRRSGPEER